MDVTKGPFVVLKSTERTGLLTVDVAHKNWMDKTSDGTPCCWWPPGNFMKKAKKGAIPDKQEGSGWDRYDCKVVCYKSSYEEADQVAERTRYNSTTETEPEENDARKNDPKVSKRPLYTNGDEARKRKKSTTPSPTTPQGQSAPDTRVQLDATPVSSRSSQQPVAGCSRQLPPGPSRKEASGTPRQLIPGTPQQVVASANAATATPRNTTEPAAACPASCEAFQKVTLSRLFTIMTQQRQTMAIVTGLAARAQQDDAFDDFELEVAEREEDLDRTFESIQNDMAYKKKLRAYLASLGGRNINDTIRKMLLIVANRKVWGPYNVKGTNRQMRHTVVRMKAFKETPLYPIFTRILKKRFPDADTDTSLNDVLKQYPPPKVMEVVEENLDDSDDTDDGDNSDNSDSDDSNER